MAMPMGRPTFPHVPHANDVPEQHSICLWDSWWGHMVMIDPNEDLPDIELELPAEQMRFPRLGKSDLAKIFVG